MRYRVDDGGDTTILMNSVKVKGIQQWEDINKSTDKVSFIAKSQDRSMVGASLESGISLGFSMKKALESPSFANFEMNKIKCKTAITYHRLYKFGELFKLNNLTIQILLKSFSPEHNTD